MDSKVANNESVKGNSANRFDKSKVYILDGDVSLALGSRLGFQDTTRDKCWPASALKVSITSITYVRNLANVFLFGYVVCMYVAVGLLKHSSSVHST